MRKIIIIIFLLINFVSCSEDDIYEVNQEYIIKHNKGTNILYDIKTYINREEYYEKISGKQIDTIYESLKIDIKSKDIDSVLLKERSKANLLISELKNIDKITSK